MMNEDEQRRKTKMEKRVKETVRVRQWSKGMKTKTINFCIQNHIIIIINFSQTDRGHTKGEPVLGAPPYIHYETHTYTHTITRTKTI